MDSLSANLTVAPTAGKKLVTSLPDRLETCISNNFIILYQVLKFVYEFERFLSRDIAQSKVKTSSQSWSRGQNIRGGHCAPTVKGEG